MARRIRLDGPAVTHHVMVRGVDGTALFLDADDRQDFVDRVSRLFPECGARCFAWVLLSTHGHFVVQTDAGSLSRVMRRLNTGYAVRCNRLRGRRGYLFMDRFRSRIVEGDADLIGLIRYVHANPVEAGLARSLDELAAYPWCGHAALLGARPALPFEAVEATLSLFDDDPQRARTELLAWMARDDEPGATLPRVRPVPALHRSYEPGGELAALMRAACARYELAPDELASGRKQPRIARARSVVAYVGIVELGEAGSVVARALGVSHAAVSAALDRGRLAALEDGFGLGPGERSPLRGESEI